MDFGLKAGKGGGANCVEVQWNKVESGACDVKYEVILKSASGSIEYSGLGYNIGKIAPCGLATVINVTDVQLTVTFKSISKTVTAKVSETPLTTQTPTPPGMTPYYSTRFLYANWCQSNNALNAISRLIFQLYCICSV